MSPQPHKVLVVMGSVRAGRLCPLISDWVTTIGQPETALAFERVDLADWPLPMDDEPNIPAIGPYVQSHTQAWADKIRQADAFIFVSPQYNWGYPAVLKNAIDHCYNEWHGKPLLIVTYGGHGGGKCGAQLRQVAEGLDMRVASVMPGLTLTRAMMGGARIDPDADFADQRFNIRQGCEELVALLSAS